MHSKNLFREAGRVSREERQTLLNQQGITIWLTGISGSGKSTIAMALDQYFLQHGLASYVLDGDNIRHGLSSDLGFGAKDRKENIRRIGEACCLFADAGIITIASFISPYEADRALVKNLHQQQQLPLVEIFVNTPLSVCEQRDVKGLYKKARAGEIQNFTAISAPYEAPKNPDLILSPHKQEVEACCNAIITMLMEKNHLSNIVMRR